MKRTIQTMLCILASCLASVSFGAIASYEAGVAPGTDSPAVNPADQGWTRVMEGSGGGAGIATYDSSTRPTDGGLYTTFPVSGRGGWSTVDGTSSNNIFYSQTLSTEQQTSMSSGWSMNLTFAVDSSYWGGSGNPEVNFYKNSTADNLIGSLGFGVATSDYKYRITLIKTAGNTIYVTDGTQSWSGSWEWDTFNQASIVYDGASAVLNIGASSYAIAEAPGITNENSVFFGSVVAGDASGYCGSATWNNVNLSIPEPATLSLLALGGGLFIRRRRK